MKAILAKIYIRFLKWKFRLTKQVIFDSGSRINRLSEFEGANRLYRGSYLHSAHLGYGSYLAEDAIISRAKVGKFCSIGPRVSCVFGKHPSHTFVSTHPSFFSNLKQVGFSFTKEQHFKEFSEPFEKDYLISIGNDVWIGAEATLMEGVKIGDGAIIAAKALVTKDVAPYTIVGGVPAKTIKHRFSPEEIEFLLELEWWNKPLTWIEDHADKFSDIKQLKAELENRTPSQKG